MNRLLSIGECMIELSGAGGDLWRLGIAGDTLNAAWYARACLPADWSVAYGTVIGTDGFSRKVPAFLAENRIETDRILTHPGRSIGLYAISLKDGERSFSYWRDTSAARTLADDPRALQRMTADAGVILVSGITLAILPPAGREALLAVLAARRAEGVLTVLDPNIRPRLWEDKQTVRTVITTAARTASVVLPSFDDEHACFGDASPSATRERYAGLGADTVVVKNGGAPVLACHRGARHEISLLDRVQPVDTTGAGDSFNGAFLAAFVTGATIPEAVAQGHRVALQVVSRPGALLPMDTLAR